MDKHTFLRATAKTQRELLFDEMREVRADLKGFKKGLHLSAFAGGFVAIFAACGGYTLIEYFRRVGT